ncbi:hypothetical protein ACI65C_008885 [Semiaphis heraclei]
MNLYIIYETSDYTNCIVHWKPNRKDIRIFNKNVHWTPGIITKTDHPHKFNNLTINTAFPDFRTIKKHIDHFLYEGLERLKIPHQNSIVNNYTDFNINNSKPIDKSTIWYSQYCHNCEKLASSQYDSNIIPKKSENEAFWTKDGDIMLCKICGDYVRQYSDRPIQDKELTLVNNSNESLNQHKNITKINNNNSDTNNQHSDMERAFFDEVQDAVMYDKSIPLVYTQEIKNDEGTINDVWQIEKYCLDKDSNYCKITRQILTFLKNINENIHGNLFDMSDTLLKRFNDNKRSKGRKSTNMLNVDRLRNPLEIAQYRKRIAEELCITNEKTKNAMPAKIHQKKKKEKEDKSTTPTAYTILYC